MDNIESFVARIYANIRSFERNVNKAMAQAEKVPDELVTEVDANISKFRRGLLLAEALARRFSATDIEKDVKVRMDGNMLRRAYHAITKNFTDPFNRRMGELATNIRSIGTVMGNVFKGALFASMTALVPIIAGLVSAVMALGVALGVTAGMVGGLAGAFAIAGAGGLAFGGIVATVLKRYNDEAFQATEASNRFTSALDGIKSTWSGIVDSHMDATFDIMANAINGANSALQQMVPFIDGVVGKISEMSGEFQNFLDKSPTMTRFFDNMNSTGVTVFENIIKASGQFGKGLIDMMNAAMPLIEYVAQGFNNLGEQFAEWAARMAEQNGFHDFRNYVMENLPKIGEIFGNTFLGIIDLFVAFGQNSSHVFDGLVRMTERFREWANELRNNTAFQDFVSYIERTGPVVVDLIGNIIMTLVNLGIALAPLGEAVLNVANKIFEFTNELLRNHPIVGMIIGVVTTLAGVFMMVVPAAIAVWTAIQAVSKVMALVSAKVLAVISILGLLAGTFIYLWQTNEQFRDRVMSIWTQVQQIISTAVSTVVAFVMEIWGMLVNWWNQNQQNILTIVTIVWNLILSVVEHVMTTLVPVISNAWNTISSVITTVLGVILTIASTVIGWIAQFWTQNHETILNTATTIWNGALNVITSVIGFIWSVVSTIVGSIVAFWQNNHQTIIAVSQMVWQAVWGFISTILSGIWGIVTSIWGAVSAFWSQHSEKIMAIVSVVFPAILAIIGGVLAGIVAVVTGALHIITGIFKVGFELIQGIVKTVMNVVTGFIGIGLSIITGDFQGAWDGLISMTMDTFGIIGETVMNVMGAIGDTVGKVFGFIGDVLGLAKDDTAAKTAEMAESVSTNTATMSNNAQTNTSAMQGNVNTNTSMMANNASTDFSSLSSNGLNSAATLNTGVTSQTGYMRDHATADIRGLNTTGSSDFASLHSTGATEASGLNADFTSQIEALSSGSTAETANMDSIMSSDFQSLANTGVTESSGLSTDVLSEFEGMNSGSTAELDSLLSNSNGNFADISSTGTSETSNMNKAATQSYRSMQMAGTTSMKAMSQATNAGMSRMTSATISGMSAMVSAITSGGARSVASVQSTMARSTATIRGSYGAFSSAGAYVMSGFRAGMISQSGSVMATASNIANRAAATIRRALKIKSPSRVLMRVGEYTSQGLALGIAHDADRVVNEMLKVSNRLQDSYAPDLAPIGPEVDKDLNNINRQFSGEITVDLKSAVDNRRPIINVTVRNEGDLEAIRTAIHTEDGIEDSLAF